MKAVLFKGLYFSCRPQHVSFRTISKYQALEHYSDIAMRMSCLYMYLLSLPSRKFRLWTSFFLI